MKAERWPLPSPPHPEVTSFRRVDFLAIFEFCRFRSQSNVLCDLLEEQPVGKVSNLRVVESLGSTVRLGWTGVAGATQYRIIILNTEGQHAS